MLQPPAHLPNTSVAFSIFDADADGYVTHDDMLAVLLATNRRGLSSSQLAQIVQATVAAFDADGDGRLCAAEFRAMISCAAIRAGEQGF